MKYLLVTIEGGGNIPPVLHTVKELIGAGHQVVVLSEPWFKGLAVATGATFVPFKEFFTKTDRNEDILEDWKDKNNAFRVFFGKAGLVADETLQVIRDHQIDAIIADVLTPGALIAAERMQIPGIVLFHMPEYLPAPNRPPGGLGLVPVNNAFGRLRDRLLGRVFNLIFDQYLPPINAARKQHGLSPMQHTRAFFDNATLRVIQTSAAFDFPIQPLPANVRYTGPVLDDPDWAGTWQSPFDANDQRPLVVVSLSSTFQNQQQAIQNCIDGLGQLPVRALVTLGPAMEKEKFHAAENVRIVSNASHAQIFPQAACLLTHAGHGTVVRALANGVPMVCLPMGRDQDDNAAKVAYHGAGIRLSPKASANKIQAAVANVLADPAYRTRAAQLGAVIKKDAEQSGLVKALEGVFG